MRNTIVRPTKIQITAESIQPQTGARIIEDLLRYSDRGLPFSITSIKTTQTVIETWNIDRQVETE